MTITRTDSSASPAGGALRGDELLIPDWPLPRGVRAIVTTRRGGRSVAPYDGGSASAADAATAHGQTSSPAIGLGERGVAPGLNLGLHTGDRVEDVLWNRQRVEATVGPRRIAWLDQCHGADTVAATAAINALASNTAPLRADAVVTHRSDEVCAIMVADCLPVLLCDRAGRAVGAAHAGWRGLCAGVIERAVQAVAVAADASAVDGRDLMAYLGPAIGPQAFEVGEDVLAAFLEAAWPTEREATRGLFVPQGHGAADQPIKYRADLNGLARLRLARVGVVAVYGVQHCTFSTPEDFYSYRRDGRTGRFAALIWREV